MGDLLLVMTKRIETLVEAICGTPEHPLAPVLRAWCGESRAFLAFAEIHVSKMRKKVRLAASEDERADLLAELSVAARLLRDARFALVYEPQMASGGRGPDFLVRFRTHPAFHAEVTRLRPGETEFSLKFARVLADKVGQLRAGGANLLVALVPEDATIETLITEALGRLDRASQPTRDSFPPGLPSEDVQRYFRQRERLGAVLLCHFALDGHIRTASLWLNPLARHGLSPELRRALGWG